MAKHGKFNISGPNPRVLVAPLDWGLGHATRCIPLIRELLAQNCEVIVGAEGLVKALLEKEFPEMLFLPLPGYRVHYSRNKRWLGWKMFLQAPGIFRRIYSERRWLKKIIEEQRISLVISDNRFGLSNNRVPCIYITHQLTIKTGNRFTNWLAQKIHYHYIDHFTECWVPDIKDAGGLAGDLSHPDKWPKTPVYYIGPLSRFKIFPAEKKYDLTVVLSGPEQQRSILEEILLKEMAQYPGPCLLVRGLPGNASHLKEMGPAVEIQNSLSSNELNTVILESEMIICRSGYSSVMDLVALQKKAILIPTPGQTEQEYLARYLLEKNMFYAVDQADLSLKKAIKAAAEFSFRYQQISGDDFKVQIKRILGKGMQD